MEKRTESTAHWEGRTCIGTQEKNKLKSASAPVQIAMSKEKGISAQRRRPFSSIFPSGSAGMYFNSPTAMVDIFHSLHYIVSRTTAAALQSFHIPVPSLFLLHAVYHTLYVRNSC